MLRRACFSLTRAKTGHHYKRPKHLIKNSTDEFKRSKTKQKILQDSLKVGPMSATASRERDLVYKKNRFGLVLQSSKVNESKERIQPKWKQLDHQKRDNKFEILRAAGKEPLASKKRDFAFAGSVISGDKFFDLGRLPGQSKLPGQNRKSMKIFVRNY